MEFKIDVDVFAGPMDLLLYLVKRHEVDITQVPLAKIAEEFVACAVASADYLAQMSASDYPDELDLLHAEVAESDDFLAVPATRRMFKSLADLRTRTGKFWVKVVRPKLDTDFKAVHRYLDAPDGGNPWLEAIERNLALIAERARSA